MRRVDHPDFHSLEELSQVLEQLGYKLHAKNRIAPCESDVLWFLAETILRAGLVAKLASKAEHHDDILHGFEPAENKHDPDVMRFLSLLSAQATD